jgi:hypothetical protein
MEHRLLTKDVILFKNVLKDAAATHDFVLRSKTNKDKWFGDWQDWRPWGQYSKAYPYENPDYINDTAEGAEHLREFLDIFWGAMKIYKENYLNEDYFTLIGEDPNIPTSMAEARQHPKYCSADVVILESENTDKSLNLSMEYHQDRRPWFGGTPHIFNFNIYTNDEYEGGDILIIDTENAEKSTYIDASGVERECLMIDEPVRYKMEAGDGLLFRTDVYHAVLPVVGNKFYVRQFLTASFSQEFQDLQKSMSEEDFALYLKGKEQEGFEKYSWQCRVFNSKEEIGNGASEHQLTCVIKSS